METAKTIRPEKTEETAAMPFVRRKDEVAKSSSSIPFDAARIEAARRQGVHVFSAACDVNANLDLIASIRGKMAADQKLVAMTGEQTSLSDVRKLRSAGVDEVVPDTISPEEFDELVAELGQKKAPAAASVARRSGQVISVARARGGVGATTVAVNLAESLLDRRGHFRKTAGNSVALVDLDIQLGDIASFLDLDPNDTLYDLAMSGDEPDETFLRQAMKLHPSGLAVLTAPARFAPLDALKKSQVKRLIETLRDTYDYVVIDLPAGLAEWLEPVLAQSDRMLLVTDCAVPSIRQARRLMDFFSEQHLSLKIDLVVNHEAKPVLMRGHHKAAEKVLERSFRHWIPDEPDAARSALDRGVPLMEVSPRARMTKAISRLGRELIANLNDNDAARAAKTN